MKKQDADRLIEGYIRKLYGFAVSKCGNIDEAEELAEMLRDLGLVTPKGKNKYRQDVLDDWVEAWYKAQEEE